MEPSYGAAYMQVTPYAVEIPNRVFVGGISYNTTELELKEFFGIHGNVLDCKIITDRNGLSRGYGFVTFESEEEARLIQSKGSLFFKEKKLNVAKAVRRQGGQYSKANQEYVNGQRNIYMHSSGLLLSQQDGNWVFEQPSPHSQPGKPFYAVEPVQMVLPPPPQYMPPTHNVPPGTPTISSYIQSPPPLSVSQVYSGSYYPALPSPTYTYVAQPMPPSSELPVSISNGPIILPPPPTSQNSIHLQDLHPAQSVDPGESNPQQSAVAEKEEENKEKVSAGLSGTGTTEQPDNDIAVLEEQTEALSLTASSVNDSPKDTLSKPVPKPGANGLLRTPSSFQQPRRPPRYVNRRPPPIRSRPPQPNLHSPVYQPNIQYNCLPGYQGPMALHTEYFPTPLTYN